MDIDRTSAGPGSDDAMKPVTLTELHLLDCHRGVLPTTVHAINAQRKRQAAVG
jgi:hypothetical protein